MPGSDAGRRIFYLMVMNNGAYFARELWQPCKIGGFPLGKMFYLFPLGNNEEGADEQCGLGTMCQSFMVKGGEVTSARGSLPSPVNDKPPRIERLGRRCARCGWMICVSYKYVMYVHIRHTYKAASFGRRV